MGVVFLDVLWYTTCMSKRITKRYKDMTPEERKVYDRSGHLRRKYGIDLSEYDIMREEQGYCCLLCGRHEDDLPARGNPAKGRPPDPLVVDHCHETGDVRGLLCSRCNDGLGKLCDDPEMLRKGIAYLEEGRADSGG